MTKSKAKAIPKDKNAKTLYTLRSGVHTRREGAEWKIYKAPCEIWLTTNEWWDLKERVEAVKAKVIYNPFEGKEDAESSE